MSFSTPSVKESAHDHSSSGVTGSTKSQQRTTKNLKRSREASVEITSIHPAKKNFRLDIGHISIPRNDASAYERDEQMYSFYTFCPLDHTNLRKAKQGRFQNVVTYGMHGNGTVEALVLDPEDHVPWQVAKVTLEYGPINYKSNDQPYTVSLIGCDGHQVSPTTIPTTEQMTGAEYEEAVENGDFRVAMGGNRFAYDFCRDAGLEWLPYKDR